MEIRADAQCTSDPAGIIVKAPGYMQGAAAIARKDLVFSLL